MSETSIDKLSRMQEALSHPAELLSIDIDELLKMDSRQLVALSRAVHKGHVQLHVASLLLLASAIIKEGHDGSSTSTIQKFLKFIAEDYFPLTVIKQAINLIYFINNNAIDKSLSLSYEHYYRILSLYKDISARALPDAGLDPKRMIASIVAKGYSASYVRKLAETLKNILNVMYIENPVDEDVKKNVRAVIGKIFSEYGE